MLAITACATTEDSLDTSSVDSEASVYQWGDDVQIPNTSSDYQVGLAELGGRLHMIYRAANDNLVNYQLKWARFTGSSWAAPTTIPNTAADYGPAVAVFNNQLTVAYHAYGQNRFLMTTFVNNAWTTPVTAGTSVGSSTIRYAPALSVQSNRLFMAYCKDSSDHDRVQVDRFDGASWTSAATYDIPTVYHCKHVTIAALPNNRFDVMWDVESDNTGNYLVYEATGAGTPSSGVIPHYTSMMSKKPISIVTCNGLTHFVHGGNSTPREIWWTDLEGGSWIGDAKVPNQASEGGAVLGCLGTRTFMVHNGGTPQLWMSEFGL
jgi:hypothetical protein